MGVFQGLALEAFERELLRQQHIPLNEAALGNETPLLHALAVVAELFDVDRAHVPDEVSEAGIAARYLEGSNGVELVPLDWAVGGDENDWHVKAIYPYLPKATVATTSARSYMELLVGAAS
jgi:hypothetical protein